MPESKIKVLIVDDSALMRNVISKIVDSTNDMEVVGTAINGVFALRKLEPRNPDIIILDLEMPEMNGIEFLTERRNRGIEVPVVILSSIAKKGAKITMDALALGASDFILKPSGTDAKELSRVEDEIVSNLRAYGRREQRKNRRAALAGAPVRAKQVAEEGRSIRAIAIGVSTGGPNALRVLFRNIDPAIKVPVFVVQHMPAGFTAEFAESLNRISPIEIKEAEAGDVASSGRVFIAPGNRHLSVVRKRLANVIELGDQEPVNGHRPSADVLFSSIAYVYAANSLAIIMTGMGKDGARSIGEIKDAGGVTVAQDEESCVVYGMPRVAVELGNVDTVVSLNEIPNLINELILA